VILELSPFEVSTLEFHYDLWYENKYVRLLGLTYIHTCRSYLHTPRELDRHVVESPTGTFIILYALADSFDSGLLGEQSSQKCEIPCQRCPAKFEAASFILGGEIRDRTNQQTNKKTQTVNDISTPCLSACGKVIFRAAQGQVVLLLFDRQHITISY